MLEWDDLRVFLAIARHGSLTAAARALRVTQPTMGRRLEVLEERLGVRLFERVPSGAVLTETGRAILEYAERMEAAALAAERRIAARDTGLEGTVRVTCVEWFGQHVIAPTIAKFCAEHPGITVELITAARLYNLAKRETDIAVRFARFDQHGLVQRKIAEIGYGIYASADYLERHGTPDFAFAGEGHSLISMPEEASQFADMHWLERIAPRGRVVLRTNSRDAHLEAAEAGAGLAVLPRCLGDRASLRRISLPSPVPGREVWLGVHEDMRQTPRVRAFIDALAEDVRRRGPELNPPAADPE